jgi:hypothetical protein
MQELEAGNAKLRGIYTELALESGRQLPLTATRSFAGTGFL